MAKWWRGHPGWSTFFIALFGCGVLVVLGASRLEVAGLFAFGLLISAINGLRAVR
jgi:hypothetical protein